MAFLWSEFGKDVDGELLKMAGALCLTVCTPLEDLQLRQFRIAPKDWEIPSVEISGFGVMEFVCRGKMTTPLEVTGSVIKGMVL